MNAAAPVTAPRLSIHHLLLWTAATAVTLVTMPRGELVYGSHPTPVLRFLQAAYGVIAGVFVAAFLYWAIAIAPKVLSRRRQSEDWGAHPGHWLLLLGGLEAISSHAAALLLRPIAYFDRSVELEAFIGVTFLLSMIVTAGVWLLMARFADWSAKWRIAFGVLAFQRFVCCFGSPWSSSAAVIASADYVSGEFTWGDLVVPVALSTILFAVHFLVALLDDWWSATRRDLFHFVGIGATTVLLVWIWCWAAVVQFVS